MTKVLRRGIMSLTTLVFLLFQLVIKDKLTINDLKK